MNSFTPNSSTHQLTHFSMSPNRRIFLNIVATYERSLCALVCGLFISRWVLAAAGKSEFGLCGVVGGMMVIELLAYTMRPDRGRFAAAGCSSMGAGSMGGENYSGKLLWQSSLFPCKV